jgi:hypothetical protein
LVWKQVDGICSDGFGEGGLQSEAGVQTVREWLGLAARLDRRQFMGFPWNVVVMVSGHMTLLGRSRSTTSTVNGMNEESR